MKRIIGADMPQLKSLIHRGVLGSRGNIAVWMVWAIWCAAIFSVVGCENPEVDVAISRGELQEKVTAKFPVEKNMIVATISLHSPQVYLAQEKVGLKLKFDAALLKHGLNGSLDGRGTIRYQADSAQFFVKDFELISLEVGDKSFGDVEKLKGIILPLLNNYLQDTPVYTVKDDSVKGTLTGKLLKRVAAKEDALVVTLGP